MRTALHRLIEIGAHEAAERIDRDGHPSSQLLEARPSEWSCCRMGRRRQYRSENYEVDIKLDGACELGVVVTRCRANHIVGPSLRG